MKIGIYVRVSTSDKQNVNTQLTFLRAYALQNALEVTQEYCDIGVSGSKESRPQFDLLLQDIRLGNIDAVLVYKLDRIGRSLSHLVKLFEEFQRKKVNFISATQSINTTTPEGRMFLHVLMTMAEYERELTINRIHSGLERARKEGKIRKRGKDKGQRKRSGYWQRWAGKKTPPQIVVVPHAENLVSK